MDKPDVVTEDAAERRPGVPAAPPARPTWPVRLYALVRAFVRPRRRWCWGTRLVVTASLAWLAFVILHRLLSGLTWLWAPFDLIPPIMFLAVPAALLAVAPLARPVRWRIMATLLVSALLGFGFSGVNLATVWYTPPPAPPGAITVVSWNTEFWDQNWRSADGDAYDAGFYEYLRGMNADVYLLKEYLYSAGGNGFDGEWTADMAIRIDKLAQLRREFPGYAIAISGEQITLSRLPIVRQYGIDLRPWLPARWRAIPPSLRTWPESFTSETLRTDIRVGGSIVSFYNAQILQPPMGWRLYQAKARAADRYNQARRAASYAALRHDVEHNGNPAVLGADLNTSPAMGVRRLLPGKLVDESRALSSIYPTTWGQAGGIPLWRIDWVLATRDVIVHRHELPGAAGLSDHRAQRVVLSVRRQA
ncbi:MAG TPA: endonuclease/exonuclease/phosphatase family protein [Streptosporangiaceae bacterium]|nr:endonuclease/exonuclease/phosphatase family protein [Streptosporangiaceae bacterium]